MTPLSRHGGKILADQLAAHGVRRVFSVPGESFLAALDGLYDRKIENIVCRQEGGAAMMAEAHAKTTGEVGVLFVTRGPGASNAASGLHVAMHDSTPLVCFVGQVPLAHRDRAAFQEVDYRAFFGPLVKWVAEVEQTDRLPEYIARAFRVAQSGRKGPVVLALPEDILSAVADCVDLAPSGVSSSLPDPQIVREWLGALAACKSPMMVVGGSDWSEQTRADAETIAAHLDIPIATSFRRQDYVDNHHPCFAGYLGVGACPATMQSFAKADRVLALGTRMGEVVTGGYVLRDPRKGWQGRLYHAHTDPDELGRVYRPDASMVCDIPAFLRVARAVLDDIPAQDQGRAARAHAAYRAWQNPQTTTGDVRLEEVVLEMSRILGGRGIVTNGAGNYAAFVHRYFSYRRYGQQLAPTSGSMGYGLPAAVAAKLAHREIPVICTAGDGCLQMTLQELSTARQFGADIVVVIANNGRYGTIRMHQEKTYPARVSGTDLFNPDYAALAQAYGGTGHLVTRTAEFAPAFEAALEGGLHLIELRLDPDMLAPSFNLSDLKC